MGLKGEPVVFSGGETVAVAAVPPAMLSALQQRYAEDPAKLRQMMNEVPLLAAFGALDVPDDWEFPEALVYAGIQPRQGESGRRLDYIEYGLMRRPEDWERANAAMFGEIAEGEVEAVAEEMFPPAGGAPSDS